MSTVRPFSNGMLEPILIRLLRRLNVQHTDFRFAGGGRETLHRIQAYTVSYIVYDDQYNRFTIWDVHGLTCVDAYVDKQDMTATMNLQYKNTCTVDGRMERGRGTRDMINFAFRFLKANGIKSVHIMDEATVPCKGKRVLLGAMYFLKHGVTWYEKTFGFVPAPRCVKWVEKARESRLRILNIPALQTAPCDIFTDDWVNMMFSRLDGGRDFLHRTEWIKYL